MSGTNPLIRASFTILLLCLFFFSAPECHRQSNVAARAQNPATAMAQMPARRNIARFFAKLNAGKPVTVAYFGGSITAGSGASDPAKTSYRALVTEWLRARYPQSKITEVNASVGGTGSLYGTMRARRDVIAHKPDLVFVEFAVNDAAEKEDVVKRAIEGIIRQLLTVPQPAEVVMVYTSTSSRNACAAWHEAVAGYYRIPAINLQDQIWSLIDAGKITPAAFWKDGVHPLDDGHSIYAKLITEFLAQQEQQTPSPLVRTLQPPLVSDELTYGELIPYAQLKREPGWRTEAVTDRTLPSTLLVGDKAGVQLETVFEGTVVGLAYRMGPDGGTMDCLIDGKPAPAPLDHIDTYYGIHHIATRIVAGGLGPGEHRLTIRISGEKNPKSSGTQVRLGYLLVGGQRPERL